MLFLDCFNVLKHTIKYFKYMYKFLTRSEINILFYNFCRYSNRFIYEKIFINKC